jgi:hypothetical protein
MKTKKPKLCAAQRGFFFGLLLNKERERSEQSSFLMELTPFPSLLRKEG